MGKHIALLLTTILLSVSVTSQNYPVRENDLLLQGYGEKINGIEFWYHSALEDVHEAYLVRATNGKDDMSWLTEPVPENLQADFVSFAWLAGIGAHLGQVNMHLSVNDVPVGTFITRSERDWEIPLTNGGSLSFTTSLVDGANDHLGFMILRMPRESIDPGKPLKLHVRGEASNSQAWYMTFLAPIPTGMSYTAYPAIYRINGEKKQPLNIQVVYFGQPTPVSFTMNGKVLKDGQLDFGVQTFQIGLDPVDYPLEVTINMHADPLTETINFMQLPIRQWTVGFVQHSHTDIGYTRPQHEILAEHIRYIDYALDYCDATDTYPEEARFKWTCEAAFAVEDYLLSRPDDQIQRLKERIQEGRIEVTGMYFNFDEMPDEHTLAESLSPMKTFRDFDIPVTAAMQNDVNGIGWCFADYFPALGIRYLNMGTHGHRALICFDRPTAFWWESPAGNRVLTFRAEHYMTGNTVFGIHTDNFSNFENKLMNYLNDLGQKDYPYDFIHIQHSGYQTDNAPPSTRSSEMIRQWNEKYEWPKLHTATTSEFFRAIEKEYADDLPVYRAAWPDWWTDGFASGAREAATSRAAHADLLAWHGALTMAGILGSALPDGIDDRIEEATKALIFYDEHTFGHAQSVREPFSSGTMEQRSFKESYAWEAFRRSRRVGEEAMGLLQGYIKREDVPVIALFNTMAFTRSGQVSLYIDHQLWPTGNSHLLIDAHGKPVPAQAEAHRSDGTYWSIFAEDIPGYGMKKLRIVPKTVSYHPPETTIQDNQTTIDLQNKWYYLQIDKVNGVMTKLIDNDGNRNLIDSSAKWGFGSFILEKTANRSEMEAYRLDTYTRQELDNIRFESVEDGPVWTTVRFSGESETLHAPDGFQLEIRLFKTMKQIDLVYTLRKKAIQDPESIYLSFPFHIPDGKIHFDVPGGTVAAGIDQIPGSTTDWNTIQNFASISNGTTQVILTSMEAPLMQLGGINTGRFVAGSTPEKTHLYGWPMNNYWVTNFNADQRGETTFTYSFTTGVDQGTQKATQVGWNRRVPMIGRTLPPAIRTLEQTFMPENTGLLQGIPDNVLVISSIHDPNDQKIILHVREIGAKETTIHLSFFDQRSWTAIECDAIGDPLNTPDSLQLQPLESKFIQISY